MSSKTEINIWSHGVDAFEEGDLEGAVDAWKEIADYSKIHFNLAIVFMSAEYWDDAIDALSRAISCDNYMAISYYVRGYCHFVAQEYEQAHNDFSLGLQMMRGNDSVDYTQLGLCFQLFCCEFYFNRALCLMALGSPGEASADLHKAKSCMSETSINDHNLIDQAIRLQEEAIKGLPLFTMPLNLVFKPSEYKTRNVGKVDYLGKSRVVASADNDTYNGFSGTLIRKQALNIPKISELSPIKRSQTVTVFKSSNVDGNSPTCARTASEASRPRKASEGSINFYKERTSSICIPQRKMSMTLLRMPTRQSNSPTYSRKKSIEGISEKSSESSIGTDKIKIKCHYEGKTRMALVAFDADINHLEDKLCKKFAIDQINIRYKDKDNEFVSIRDQEDFVLAMSAFGIEWGNYGLSNKMELYCS